MNLEKVYKENINRKTQEIKEIPEDFKLQSSIKNISIKNKKIILIAYILIIILIIFVYLNSLKAMISALFLLTIITFFSIWFNKFLIVKSKDDVVIKTNTEEIKINVNNIKNIYLEENYYRIFIKKRKSYSLVILYKTPNNNILDIRLNTSLISQKELKNMFSKIILKDKKVNNYQKCINYKRKRILKKIIIFSILLLLAFIVLQIQRLFN